MFAAVYISLYVAFVLGIYTLDRAYYRYFTAVEQTSSIEDPGCEYSIELMTDVSYYLFTIGFGDNLSGTLTNGRQTAENVCGNLMVLTARYTFSTFIEISNTNLTRLIQHSCFFHVAIA